VQLLDIARRVSRYRASVQEPLHMFPRKWRNCQLVSSLSWANIIRFLPLTL